MNSQSEVGAVGGVSVLQRDGERKSMTSVSSPRASSLMVSNCFHITSQPYAVRIFISSISQLKKQGLRKVKWFAHNCSARAWIQDFNIYLPLSQGFPGSSVVKESTCQAGDLGLIPESGRSPGERNGYPLWYSCLGRAAWRATACGVTRESDTTKWLNSSSSLWAPEL